MSEKKSLGRIPEGSSERNLRQEERSSEQETQHRSRHLKNYHQKPPKTADPNTFLQNRPCGTRSDKNPLRTTPKKRRTFKKENTKAEKKPIRKKSSISCCFHTPKAEKKYQTLPNPPRPTPYDKKRCKTLRTLKNEQPNIGGPNLNCKVANRTTKQPPNEPRH